MGDWAYPVAALGAALLVVGLIAIVGRLAGANGWAWRSLFSMEAIGMLLMAPAVIDCASTFSGCNANTC